MKALVDQFNIEELTEKVKQSNCWRDLALKLGYSSDGGTGYKTVRDRVQKYGIDTSHFYTKEATIRTPENIFIEKFYC